MTVRSFGLILALSFCAQSQQVDCPAAFRTYSSGGTPLLDLMIDPAAKAVVDRDLPGFFAKLPPILVKPAPPTLADILTIRIMSSEFAPISEETLGSGTSYARGRHCQMRAI